MYLIFKRTSRRGRRGGGGGCEFDGRIRGGERLERLERLKWKGKEGEG